MTVRNKSYYRELNSSGSAEAGTQDDAEVLVLEPSGVHADGPNDFTDIGGQLTKLVVSAEEPLRFQLRVGQDVFGTEGTDYRTVADLVTDEKSIGSFDEPVCEVGAGESIGVFVMDSADENHLASASAKVHEFKA